jgi:hypothetical protein
VDVVLAERLLPMRLKTDETWEGWTPAADLADASDVELLGRVLVTA